MTTDERRSPGDQHALIVIRHIRCALSRRLHKRSPVMEFEMTGSCHHWSQRFLSSRLSIHPSDGTGSCELLSKSITQHEASLLIWTRLESSSHRTYVSRGRDRCHAAIRSDRYLRVRRFDRILGIGRCRRLLARAVHHDLLAVSEAP